MLQSTDGKGGHEVLTVQKNIVPSLKFKGLSVTIDCRDNTCIVYLHDKSIKHKVPHPFQSFLQATCMLQSPQRRAIPVL
ncbi:hypothetical protein SLE2022_365580 [Rubroshorea leprosula]